MLSRYVYKTITEGDLLLVPYFDIPPHPPYSHPTLSNLPQDILQNFRRVLAKFSPNFHRVFAEVLPNCRSFIEFLLNFYRIVEFPPKHFLPNYSFQVNFEFIFNSTQLLYLFYLHCNVTPMESQVYPFLILVSLPPP